MIEKSWRDQPERAEGADDVIRVILRIVHMGVMLQMHPREHRKTETQQKSGTVAHGLVDPGNGVGRLVAGVMHNGSFKVQREEPCAEQHQQRPIGDKPAPDRQCSEGIAPQKQTNRGIPRRWRIDEALRHRAQTPLSRRRCELCESLSHSAKRVGC